MTVDPNRLLEAFTSQLREQFASALADAAEDRKESHRALGEYWRPLITRDKTIDASVVDDESLGVIVASNSLTIDVSEHTSNALYAAGYEQALEDLLSLFDAYLRGLASLRN